MIWLMCPFDLSQNVVRFQVKLQKRVFEVRWTPEFKCQKRLSVLLRGVLKIQAPLLTLKADLHFGKKKIIVQLDDACRSEFDRQGHVEY